MSLCYALSLPQYPISDIGDLFCSAPTLYPYMAPLSPPPNNESRLYPCRHSKVILGLSKPPIYLVDN